MVVNFTSQLNEAGPLPTTPILIWVWMESGVGDVVTDAWLPTIVDNPANILISFVAGIPIAFQIQYCSHLTKKIEKKIARACI